MFGFTCTESVLLLLSVVSLYTTVLTEDDALRDNENKFLFDRLLVNLRSSANRQGAVNELIRNYIPEGQSSRNENLLLDVLANIANSPLDFGGPVDDLSGNADIWNDMPESTENRLKLQLGELNKRWGSGPGPRGKRFVADVNSRVRRRDGPGPRGKRQGPRGKKQGPRGKKEDEEDLYCLRNPCLQTMVNTKYVCDCTKKDDPVNCQAIEDNQ